MEGYICAIQEQEFKTKETLKRCEKDPTKESQMSKIVEVSVHVDMNLGQAREEKDTKYMPLTSQLQKMYGAYKFEIILVQRDPAFKKVNFSF